MKIKNVWSCQFVGHYPVGAVVIITARNQTEAARKLETALAEKGLSQRIKPEDVKQVETGVTILLDGNY